METTYILQDLWAYIKTTPSTWVGAGIIVILLCIWVAYRRSQYSFCINQSNVGKVQVSQSALYHLVKGTCENIGTLSCHSIDFTKIGNKFDIEIKLKANVSQNITDLSQRLHQILTQALSKILGPDRIGKVNVIVIGFKGELKDEVAVQEPTEAAILPENQFKVLVPIPTSGSDKS